MSASSAGSRSGRLRAALVEVTHLSETQRAAMWELFSRYYAEVTIEQFRRDLLAKQRVVLLLDSGDGSIQGFSTIVVESPVIDGRRLVAVFSGDTVIEQSYW